MTDNGVIALKEWAVAISALAKGEQILLLRKGGIAEETKDFQIVEPSFYLFPTYLHQKKELLKEEYRSFVDEEIEKWEKESDKVPIQYFAEVSQDIQIDDIAQLNKLMPYHIWNEDFAEGRLHWKKDKPLHLLVVRVYEVVPNHTISMKDEYNGCKSWIRIDSPSEGFDLRPVLTDEEFKYKQREITKALDN